MRQRHRLQVSTFPFLAVLLCAMGSLILLLLVLDRRARTVARARALLSAQQTAVTQTQSEAARRAEWESRRRALHEQLLREDQEVLARVKAVQNQTTTTAQNLVSRQSDGRELRDRLQSESAWLAHAAEDLNANRTEVAQEAKKVKMSQEELGRLSAELRQMEETLHDLKALRQRQQQMHSLVPYRGKRGDNRKPLYIECAAREIVFHPDRTAVRGPALTPAGIRSEIDQRLAGGVSANDKTAENAYLLMLVRPDGITTYYQTVAALKGLKVDFGYEFIEQDWILDFPEDDSTPGKQPWMIAEKAENKQNLTPGPRKPSGIEPGLAAQPQGRSRGVVFGSGQMPAGGSWARGGAPADGSGIGEHHGEPAGFPAGTLRGDGQEGTARDWFPTGLRSPLGSPDSSSGSSSPTGAMSAGDRDTPIAGRSAKSAADQQGTLAATGAADADAGSHAPRGNPKLDALRRDTRDDADTLLGTARDAERPEGRSHAERGSEKPTDGTGSATLGAPRAEAATTSDSRGPELQPPSSPFPAFGGSQSKDSSNSSAGSPPLSTSPNAQQPGSESNSGDAKDSKAGLTTDPLARLEPKGGPRKPPRVTPLSPGLLTGNRDWIIPIDCTSDALILSPSRRIATAGLGQGSDGSNPLLEAVQQMISRRQATVRPGEPAYRPIIRFRVRPEGLRSYYLAYPALEPLRVPMTRENLETEPTDKP